VTKRINRRRTRIVDTKLQVSMAVALTGVMAGVAALYALGLYVLPSTGAMEAMNAEETRVFFLGTNLVYFAFATMVLFTVALMLTHRVAGPALVIERAIRGTMNQEFEHRLTLRKRDHLQPLAKTITEWRDQLKGTMAEQRRVAADLKNCIAEGDLEAAEELLAQLNATIPPEPQPETDDENAGAEAATEAPATATA